MKRTLSLILILLLVPTVSFAEETLSPMEISSMEEISSPIEISFCEETLLEETAPTLRTGGVKNDITLLTEEPEDVAHIPNFFAETSFRDIVISYLEAYIEETDSLPSALNVEGYGITLENIDAEYFTPIQKNPQLLLAPSVGYIDRNNDGIIELIVPQFLVSNIEEFYSERQKMMDGLQEYIDLAKQYDTPVEKLLAVHDRMVELCMYDDRVMDPDPAVSSQAPASVFHALGVFRDKFAVCQGYSQAMYMIGQELGIEIDFCRSDEAWHMWNYVKLDGKWYYMDMTNDDPRDPQGKAAHTFFLFSENKLNPNAHGTDYAIIGGGESPVCDDTTYDSNHLFNLPFLFKGYKDEDGYYNASVNFTSSREGISAVATFKSDSLYVGPVAVASLIGEGNYTVTENGQQVQKRSTNLYMIEYSFRNIGKTFPVIRFRDGYITMAKRTSMNANSAYLRGIFRNVPSDLDLTQFTTFVFGEDLTPYSTKLNWK